MPDRVLADTASAAAFAGVEPDTVHQWASRGLIRRYGTSGRRLFDLREIASLRADTPAVPVELVQDD
jgi:DNA-binding transcriptional MerR regulator